MGRKPRSDVWDAGLGEAERWKVYDYFRRHAWHEVADYIRDQFKVARPARSALYRWAARMRAQESAHRIEQALEDSQALDREMKQIGDMSERLRFAWLQLARESDLKGDVKAGERYLRMAIALSREQREGGEARIKREAEDRAREELRLREREFQQRLKGDVEKGLAALFEQVKGNADAEGLVLQLQEKVKGA